MKAMGLAMTVGGWMFAVGGLLMSDAMAVRMAMALVGIAVSAGGIFTLNATHLEHAIWKVRRS